jgi:HSP20 family protein
MAKRFAVTRWEPGLLTEMRDRFLGPTEALLNWPVYSWRRPATFEREYVAPLEVYERDGQTVVRLEVPGMKEEDIDVSVTDGLLTIKDEKKHEEEIKEENYYYTERSFGSFLRTLSIPEGIDESKLAATYDNGILELEIPKVGEQKKEHKVKVSAKKAEK